MSRRMLVDFVCFNCQAILARETEDGSWDVKILDDGGNITTEWRERFVCWRPECGAVGYVNPFDTMPTKGHGRVRFPTRPVL